MQAVFNQLEMRLGAHDTLWLDRAGTAAIMVLRGCVWITREGEREDHVLTAGQSLKVGDDRPLVLSALADARLSVRSGAARTAPGWRAALRRMGRAARALYLRVARRAAARRTPWVRAGVL